MNRNKVESLLYEPATAAEYAERCLHTCEFLAIAETANVASATNPSDLGEGRMVVFPDNLAKYGDSAESRRCSVGTRSMSCW